MAYQRLSEYQINLPLFKVSEPWKFQVSSFCVSTDETHSSKQAIFLIPNRMTKWVISDTMAYQRLPEYGVSFSLFKVSELWKFQMSSFCVSTGETQFKTGHIFLIPNRINKNESYLTQWHSKGFQNIKLVSLYSKSVSHENSKCLHFTSAQMNHIV